jgi:hypothetical protein
MEVLDYIVWLIWSCLTLTPTKLKNPAFAMALSTLDVLEQLLSDSLLIFAPVLLDVVQASTPPSMSYFKNLPTDVRTFWAVYLLVLEKPGCRPKIYVGSGTNRVGGAAKRFQDYDNQTTLPIYIRRALKDSYTIVHKGLLCRSSRAPSSTYWISFLDYHYTLHSLTLNQITTILRRSKTS